MRLPRMTVFVAVLAILASIALPIPASGQVGIAEVNEQEQAAAEVMDQLAQADRSLSLSEIQGLDELGPMPWLSLTPNRSSKAVEAWRAVAAQLPAGDLMSANAASARTAGLTFSESEAPDETGGNDTPETGDFIKGFGTGEKDEPVVTITGNLQGAEVRPPIQGDCESTEDDGSIGQANPTPAAQIQVALCVGEIGDGPFGDTSGDIDFYSFGEVEEGSILILDTYHISGSLDPVDSVIGIYTASGELLGSIEDAGIPGDDPYLEVIAPATGEYFAGIAGCCELSSDPFDSSSGPGVGDLGTYELFVVAFPPPCTSDEDDGSLALANDTAVPLQSFDFCSGIIGDGPHGDADTDFYSIGTVEPGLVIVADVFNFIDSFRSVVGIYDADGNLVASGEDSGDPEAGDYLEFEPQVAGEFFVAISGCCDLPADPTDPTSGTPSDQGGLYEILIDVFQAPCRSVEDDGSLGLANQTRVAEQGGDFCSGDIGDGPHGSSDGDFYSLGIIPAEFEVLVDVLTFEGPVRTVVGLYDADGNVVATAEDSGDPELPEFLTHTVENEGEYFVGLAGCCQLPADPTDPASGSPSDEAGSYDVFLGAFPPPCESNEEDGSIPDANDASNVFGSEELFLVDCFGEVGDGPQAELNGDVDFFRTRVLPEGRLLIVDFYDAFGEAANAGDLTIGIYNQAGDLIGSGQDDPSQGGPQSDFFSVTIPAEGEYYVAVGGGLPTDPSDPTTGTNTDIVSGYSVMTVVDTTEGFLGTGLANWGATTIASRSDELRSNEVAASVSEARAARAEGPKRTTETGPLTKLAARLTEAKSVAAVSAAVEAEPVIDTDFFLVDLKKGDAISGGFDRARVTGILDPAGVQRSGSEFNPSFIYPAGSPLAHARRNGFDHVATVDGVHAIFVTEGAADYEGELRVVRSGRATSPGDDQQIIFLDFDGGVIPGDVFGSGFDATLSPLSAFLGGWGLTPADEDAVIDATIDSVIESLDNDLRVLDGRNGDRDASGTPTEFDVEILNSRDHGDRWGDPNVTRIVIGGTIDELQIPTIGIAQSIDPGNTDPEETGIVLLDLMSGPAGSDVSINSYGLAPGTTKTEFVGSVVGNITVHEIGHLIGNWHQQTFNEIEAIMDSGGDFPAIAGVGEDGIFGNADDTDPDFVEDIFSRFEGFVGIEDTAGRSAFALSTGQGPVVGGEPLGDLSIELDGIAHPADALDVNGEFSGGVAPYTVQVNWGDGTSCPGDGTCSALAPEDDEPGLVEAAHTYGSTGVYTVTLTVTDATGATVTASADTVECTITGSNRSETLVGTNGDDVICALGGNDKVRGNGGNDIIFGGSGRDQVKGGSGDDTILGGPGSDDLNGGGGADTISGGSGNDVVDGGSGQDVLAGRMGNDRMFGGSGDDTISGNRGNDRMSGSGGDDIISGGRGDDWADGQNGKDTVRGGPGRDRVNGSNGDDNLFGGTGPDRLSGGSGNDNLDGGEGKDRCKGGSGTDVITACER